MPITPIPSARQAVTSLLSGLAAGIGIGPRSVLTWDRSGASSLELLASTPWTVEDIYGALGRFSLDIPSGLVLGAALDYRIIGDDLELTAHARLNGFAPMLAPLHPRAVGVSAVSQPVGAIGITSILTALSIVWSLLNPRVTLLLPGRMQIEMVMSNATTLLVEFKTPPTVSVVWGIRWSNVPLKLVLTDKFVRCSFRAGIFAQEKEWTF